LGDSVFIRRAIARNRFSFLTSFMVHRGAAHAANAHIPGGATATSTSTPATAFTRIREDNESGQ